MPLMFLICLFVDKSQMVWVLVPVAFAMAIVRRVIVPRLWRTKAVDSVA